MRDRRAFVLTSVSRIRIFAHISGGFANSPISGFPLLTAAKGLQAEGRSIKYAVFRR